MEYTIHDADKEKPEQGVTESREVLARDKNEKWFQAYYDFVWLTWRSSLTADRVTVTHWTELPPDPPKKKVWVKKRAAIIGEPLPPGARNIELTYEIEEKV